MGARLELVEHGAVRRRHLGDHVGEYPLAPRGKGPVRRCHLEGSDVVGTEDGGGIGLEVGLDPQPAGRVHRLLRADVLDQLGVDGVDGMHRRFQEVHLPAGWIFVVADVPHLAVGQRQIELGRRRVHLVEADSLLQGGGQHEWLEGGAGRPLALGGQVELGLGPVAEVVLAAHQGLHGARSRVDRDHRRARLMGGIGQDSGHRLLRRRLPLQIEGRGDAQAAPVEQVLASVGVGPETGVVEDELFHRVHEVGSRVLGGGLGLHADRGLLGRVSGRRLHQVERGHPVEDLVAPGHRGGGVHEGIEVIRGLDQPGQQGRLRQGEGVDVDTEVDMGCRLDAVGARSEVDGVQVQLEDLGLGVLVLEMHGELGFSDLAGDAPAGRLVLVEEDLGVLLGDGRCALHDLSGAHVVQGGPQQGPYIDPRVGPVAGILDRDHGIGQDLRHPRQRDHLAVLLGVQRGDQGSVRGVHERGLRRGDNLDRQRPAGIRAGRQPPAHQDRQGGGEGAAAGSGPQVARRPPASSGAARPSLVSHLKPCWPIGGLLPRQASVGWGRAAGTVGWGVRPVPGSDALW